MKLGNREVKKLRINNPTNREAGVLRIFAPRAFSAIIIAIFLISNIFATELPEADFPIEDLLVDFNIVNKEAQNQFSELESQWDVLCADNRNIALTISNKIHGFNLLDVLIKRIKNTTDPIFSLGSSFARLIYMKAYDLVWNKNEARAAKLFNFLINMCNLPYISSRNSN